MTSPFTLSRTHLLLGSVFFILLTGTIATGIWAASFDGAMPPRTSIGGIDVSGLPILEAQNLIQSRVDGRITEGVVISTQDAPHTKKLLALGTLVGDDFQEDVFFHVQSAIEKARVDSQGRLAGTIALVGRLMKKTDVPLDVRLIEEHVLENLAQLFPSTKQTPIDARLTFHLAEDGWETRILPGAPGVVIDHAQLFILLKEHLATLSTDDLILPIRTQEAEITEADLNDVREEAIVLLQNAPYLFVGHLDATVQEWPLTAIEMTTLLTTQKVAGKASLAIDPEALETFVTPIRASIDQEAKNARFEIQGTRVTEFAQSQQGRTLDVDYLTEHLLDDLRAQKEQIDLVVKTIEPDVKTSDVNDLGIKHLLGTGISRFAGSPQNRIKNIKNGVRLLNGRLIAPGETFSLIEALSPFTTENGYLPELVIKGDRIEPELGGGLCQIGTTTFRATMNAGLDVTERRNHSLVVSYYNDLANGNPGTDATIYDPAPDYKFTNTTDAFILFEALLIPATSELRFNFWGTSDGREGSYTPPVVQRWIPTGPTKEIETENLEPGERTCQGKHVGADTSFIYRLKHANGDVEETVFESHYRPLPEICLVGKAKVPVVDPQINPLTEDAPDPQTPDPVSEPGVL